MRNRIHKKQGTTLVELIVCMLLASIMMLMVVGIVSPAFRMFIRMQKLQYAQMITDNIISEIKSQTLEAIEYVKIYDNVTYGSATGTETGILDASGNSVSGAGKGNVLEFVNSEGYITLISAGGCPQTDLYQGTLSIGKTEDSIDPGRLAYRYYWMQSDDAGNLVYDYQIEESDGKKYGARAMTPAFGNGYYMGNYLKIQFAYPTISGPTVADGQSVPYLELTVSLYNNSDMADEHLVVTDSAILDLRYQPKRKDEATGRVKSLTPP